MIPNTLLIAGTDNFVGKTVLVTALAAYWQTYCDRRLGLFKPIQTGRGEGTDDTLAGDRALYLRLFPALPQSPAEITPLFFEAPLVPPLAAAQMGQVVQLEPIWQQLEALTQQCDWVLMEGWGGLGAPLTAETTLADLAWDWRLPTILVVPVVPGAIAQAVAHVALAQQSRVHLKGMILNCLHPESEQHRDDWAPAAFIQSLTQVPVLGYLPYLVDPTDVEKLAHVASNLPLERFMPISIRRSSTNI